MRLTSSSRSVRSRHSSEFAASIYCSKNAWALGFGQRVVYDQAIFHGNWLRTGPPMLLSFGPSADGLPERLYSNVPLFTPSILSSSAIECVRIFRQLCCFYLILRTLQS